MFERVARWLMCEAVLSEVPSRFFFFSYILKFSALTLKRGRESWSGLRDKQGPLDLLVITYEIPIIT